MFGLVASLIPISSSHFEYRALSAPIPLPPLPYANIGFSLKVKGVLRSSNRSNSGATEELDALLVKVATGLIDSDAAVGVKETGT